MNNAIFPLPFNIHLGFCIISLLFFAFQYYRLRYKYQLALALAIPSTLLIYICTNDIAFYALGLYELGMIITAIILISKQRKASAKEVAVAANAENTDSENK